MQPDIQPYDGLRFFIEVNEAIKGGSVTMHVVHGTHCRRTNKYRLKLYLTEMGVPSSQHKKVLKKLGFWGAGLGTI